ncbi:hypothetical protein Psi02_10260 [Planotetraspora silvatica]|uniref:DUF3995 domain-containing protein n=1 Tax=Planotetraspora silvatica TaxID=234614 RepID=A0A8J3XJU8_9ACTN|nr:hypothetical protein [Planotetraspora silvatica]GII44602.1 hypothetical protein Psi02_10260 [Planotetraspora silvatica]
MTTVALPATGIDSAPPRAAASWPAYWAAGWIGAFCAIVLIATGYNQLINGVPLDEGGEIALMATGLRLLTVAIALASVQAWGRRLPNWLVATGLWGAAAVQLLYPIAETAVKAAVLTGLVEPFGKGISNMSAEGWFNFGAAWLIWGVPGALFSAAAVSFARRHRVSPLGTVLGLLGGAVFLGLLGLVIG